jgi:hypothetical protein
MSKCNLVVGGYQPSGTISRVIACYLEDRARQDEGSNIPAQSPSPRAELRRPSTPTIARTHFRVARYSLRTTRWASFHIREKATNQPSDPNVALLPSIELGLRRAFQGPFRWRRWLALVSTAFRPAALLPPLPGPRRLPNRSLRARAREHVRSPYIVLLVLLGHKI